MVPRWTHHSDPSFFLARRRESCSGQHMVDFLFPPHPGSKAFVLDGTKRFRMSPFKVVPKFERRRAGRYSRAAPEQHKVAEQTEMAWCQ